MSLGGKTMSLQDAIAEAKIMKEKLFEHGLNCTSGYYSDCPDEVQEFLRTLNSSKSDWLPILIAHAEGTEFK